MRERLPSSLPRASRSERIPDPLPPALIPDLIRRQPILLCLDYDGTLSEIADEDRKSTRLNSSHPSISYAVFCLKKKKIKTNYTQKRQKEDGYMSLILASGSEIRG